MTNLIIDVDGCLTNGKFFYNSQGKVMKEFGANDSEALWLIAHRINILFLSADLRGFEISNKRVSDMGFKLKLVKSHERLEWIRKRFDLKETIYIGDGIFDSLIFEEVGFSFSPKNAFCNTAFFKLKNIGGEGAIAEAVVEICRIYLGGWNVKRLLEERLEFLKNKII